MVRTGIACVLFGLRMPLNELSRCGNGGPSQRFRTLEAQVTLPLIARRFSLGSRPVFIRLYCNSISGRFSPGDAAVTKLGELFAGCGFRFPRILDLSSAPKTTTARVLWRLCDLYKHAQQGRVWLVLTPAFAEWALRRLFGFQLSSMNARAPPPQPFLSKFGYFLVTLLILLRNPNRRKKNHQLAFLRRQHMLLSGCRWGWSFSAARGPGPNL